MAGIVRLIAALVCCMIAMSGCALHRENPAEVAPIPHPITPPSQEAIKASIDRGVQFLVGNQNSDGSWGHVRHKAFNIVMPIPSGHHGVKVAVTALCVTALIEAGEGRPGAADALARGEDWLLVNIPLVRQSATDIMYNNWTHAYSIVALVHMLKHDPGDEARRKRIGEIIQGQIDRLARYQHLDGGWGYYGSGLTSVPSIAASASFITATIMIALHDAQEAGFTVPKKTIDKAMASMRIDRRPDFGYTYTNLRGRYPLWRINKPPASMARTQAGNAAMRLWGEKATTLPIIRAWLNRLFARNYWLSMTRKQIYPHQGHFGIAAYFFYYGHYYAGLCIDLLPPEERPRFRGYLANVLVPLQEKDGCWWDFPLYDYHQQYGTAFAVMALNRCLSPSEAPAAVAQER